MCASVLDSETSFERTSSEPNGDSVFLSQSGVLSSDDGVDVIGTALVLVSDGALLGSLLSGVFVALDAAILVQANIIPKRPITATNIQTRILPRFLNFARNPHDVSVPVSVVSVGACVAGGVPARNKSFSWMIALASSERVSSNRTNSS